MAGFTLIEVIVAATIFSFVALGLAASFLSGMRLWERVRNRDYPRALFFLDLELVAKDLRQAVQVPGIGFTGSPEEFSFPAVEGEALVRVTYRYEPQSRALLRKAEPLEDVLAGRSAGAGRLVISPESLCIKYLYRDASGDVWTDAWPGDKGIFNAVWLQGTYQGEPFSKIIVIPIA
jgi:prepilin-type N-terminal cleavage/methylation domain-containing protein